MHTYHINGCVNFDRTNQKPPYQLISLYYKANNYKNKILCYDQLSKWQAMSCLLVGWVVGGFWFKYVVISREPLTQAISG